MLQGDYYLINEHEKTIEFFFSNNIKNSYFKYPLGKLLVDFLNLDLSEFESVRIKYLDFMKHPTYKKYVDLEKLSSDRSSLEVSTSSYKELVSGGSKSLVIFLFFNFFFIEKTRLNHPFSIISPYYVNYITDFSINDLIENKFNLLYQQKLFTDLINFCFNISNLEEYSRLNSKQLLAIYLHLSQFNSVWLNYIVLSKNYQLFPTSKDVIMKFYNERKGNLYSRSINKTFLREISKINFDIKEIYSNYDIPTLPFTEAMKIIELGISIRKCQNCNKYFVVKR